MKKSIAVSLLSLCMTAILAGPASAATLDDVKAKALSSAASPPTTPASQPWTAKASASDLVSISPQPWQLQWGLNPPSCP